MSFSFRLVSGLEANKKESLILSIVYLFKLIKNYLTNPVQKIHSALKKYQSDALDGYFIAKIELKYWENERLGISLKKLSNKISSYIINELIPDNQIVNVVLIQGSSEPLIQKVDAIPNQKAILIKNFTLLALGHFLKSTGDQNPIHGGENPVVPGLMILENLTEIIDFKITTFKIKFYNPLHLQNELTVYKTAENELIGFNNNLIIFKLKRT